MSTESTEQGHRCLGRQGGAEGAGACGHGELPRTQAQTRARHTAHTAPMGAPASPALGQAQGLGMDTRTRMGAAGALPGSDWQRAWWHQCCPRAGAPEASSQISAWRGRRRSVGAGPRGAGHRAVHKDRVGTGVTPGQPQPCPSGWHDQPALT